MKVSPLVSTSAVPKKVTAMAEDSIIQWAGIIRDETLLVESRTELSREVSDTVRGLLNQEQSSGWSAYAKNTWRNTYKGLKLHIYDEVEGQDELRVWVFACVYRVKAASTKQIMSFLEKLAFISEVFRESDPVWQQGGHRSCSELFTPILRHQMHEQAYLGAMAIADENFEYSNTAVLRNRHLLAKPRSRVERERLEKEEQEKELLRKMELMNQSLQDQIGPLSSSSRSGSGRLSVGIAQAVNVMMDESRWSDRAKRASASEMRENGEHSISSTERSYDASSERDCAPPVSIARKKDALLGSASKAKANIFSYFRKPQDADEADVVPGLALSPASSDGNSHDDTTGDHSHLYQPVINKEDVSLSYSVSEVDDDEESLDLDEAFRVVDRILEEDMDDDEIESLASSAYKRPSQFKKKMSVNEVRVHHDRCSADATSVLTEVPEPEERGCWGCFFFRLLPPKKNAILY